MLRSNMLLVFRKLRNTLLHFSDKTLIYAIIKKNNFFLYIRHFNANSSMMSCHNILWLCKNLLATWQAKQEAAADRIHSYFRNHPCPECQHSSHPEKDSCCSSDVCFLTQIFVSHSLREQVEQLPVFFPHHSITEA